jgi:hypothetical protein
MPTQPARILEQLRGVDGRGSGLDTDLVRGRKPGAWGLEVLAAETPAEILAGTGLPPGGATGTVLRKLSAADGNAGWSVLASIAWSGQWGDLANVPQQFPPTTHQHQWSEIIGAPTGTTRWRVALGC